MYMSHFPDIIGMLSKSKGQVLRVSAVMHILFHMAIPTAVPEEISEAAVKAADCFVDYCVQHAAYLGGRGDSEEGITDIQQGLTDYILIPIFTTLHHP